MKASTFDRYRDVGLLVLRVGIGVAFIIHGFPKIWGGPSRWHDLGTAMGVFGIHFAPAFWGFMAAIAEFVGGICVLFGFLFRPFCAMMLFTMVVATTMLLTSNNPEIVERIAKYGFSAYSEPISMGIVFLSLLIMGPGNYSLSKYMQE